MMTNSNWVSVDMRLPPEGEVVDTLSPGSLQQQLVRKGRLWFHPDFSMYVYYQPTHWRKVETLTEKAERQKAW